MAIPIKAGRDISVDDTAERPRVVLVNETLAQMLWPGQNALGRLAHTGDVTRPLHVIGVVGDVRQTSLEEGSSPQMYLAYAQVGGAGTELVIRSTLSPAVLASSVRAALGAIDPALVTSAIRPIETLVERAVSPRRFLLRLLGGFAGLALLLACLGIYGVVSYAVSQRVQEIAVRMALGATAGGVCREVLAGTLRLAAAGVGLGLIASFGLARLIAALLFGTSPTDSTTFAGTALLLTTVAVVAGAVPALRASSINPISALRAE
jgi:hypothetical protein